MPGNSEKNSKQNPLIGTSRGNLLNRGRFDAKQKSAKLERRGIARKAGTLPTELLPQGLSIFYRNRTTCQNMVALPRR